MSRPVKHILVIPSWYTTEYTPQDGLIFEEQAAMLKRAGYKIGVLFPCFIGGFIDRALRFKKNIIFSLNNVDIPTYAVLCLSIIPRSRCINYWYIYIKAKRQFREYVKLYGWPDIIQAHASLVGGVVAYYLWKKYKIPYVITEHATPLILFEQKNEDIKYVTKVCSSSYKCIAVSHFLREKLISRYRINPDKISVIHNNVSPLFFNLSKVSNKNSDFVFVVVGGLRYAKNHKLLFDSLNIAVKTISEIKIKVVGDGPLRQELEDYAKEIGIIDRIEFLGSCSRNKVKQTIDTAHALISTSRVETFGINIIEALASGRPVIATDSGGPRDIIEEGDGFLVKRHCPDDVASAMIDLIRDYKYYNSNTISERCYSKFSEAAIVTNIEKIYFHQYQICSRCILDTDDYPMIEFDENGICNICHINDKFIERVTIKGERGLKELNHLLREIGKRRLRNGYNCLLGISGGVDSTYLAMKAKEWGLKPLVVHVDNGWNSETAVGNIEKILKKLEFDLETYVVDWYSMKDMHYAFMKASVVDIELPYDNKFLAMLYSIARKYNLKHILCGYNAVSEGILPPNYTHYKFDTKNIRHIHKLFGREKRIKFNLISPLRYLIYERILGIKIISPLNYIDYNKNEAKRILTAELGWDDYGHKHYENVFTRFYQGYVLPSKYHIDKRKGHLSALICSDQLSREDALKEIQEDIYGDQFVLEEDKKFVLKKLEIFEGEFNEIMNLPVHRHTDYKSCLNDFDKIPKFVRRLMRLIIDETT